MKALHLFALLLFGVQVKSQDNSPLQSEKEKYQNTIHIEDTTGSKNSFLKTHWRAHLRTFFMSTTNEGALKDDHALAAGAGIGLITKPFYGFQFGLSGFIIYNVVSSPINELDPLTNGSNRYEIGLFNVNDLNQKTNIARVEELFLKYTYSKSSITLGRINLITHFMNPQDGRMSPSFEEGVWINIHESKTIGFNGGWIWSVSPRSTVVWTSLANSMGMYPSGVSTSGIKSNYTNNLSSEGMGIVNFYYRPHRNLKFNVWNGYLENIMNTAILEINTKTYHEKNVFYQNTMFAHQDAIKNGGNSNPSNAYIDKGAQSNIISLQFGIKYPHSDNSLNYTHITGDGRYLMPREWGRDPFYTFLPRERNEGVGNVHAFSIKTSKDLLSKSLNIGVGYGYSILPDVKNYRLNKYGMPTYQQINFDASYNFDQFFKGLIIRMLVVGKINEGETYKDLKYIYNKVNMINFNFTVDFKI